MANSDRLVDTAVVFTDRFFRGEFEAMVPLMDEAMRKAFPPDKAAAVLAGIESQAGAMISAGRALRTHSQQGYRIVIRPVNFERADLEAKVVFDADGLVGGFSFTPSALVIEPPDPPYSDAARFTEEEIIVGEGEFALPGTLTIPRETERPPVAVFIHGSGPNDRDETIGPNKIFRDIARGLATRGIASLRYDKRTLVHPEKLRGLEITHREEVIEDAVAAARLVAADPRFDPERVILIGHSLGGTLAPLVAAECCEVDAVVMLAASCRPLLDVMTEQLEYLVGIDGITDREDQIMLEEHAESVRLIREGKPGRGALASAPPGYFAALEAYDEIATASQLMIPVRILQGGRDYQVTAEKDFAKWKAALSEHANVTFELYPGLDHLFRRGEGPSQPSDYMVPGNPDWEFVIGLAEWIASLGVPAGGGGSAD